MSLLRNAVKEVVGEGFKPMEGPVGYIVDFSFPLPHGMSKANKLAMDGTYHTARPDYDNVCKFLNDALNDFLWKDDRQICMALVEKRWTKSREGCTLLRVFDLTKDCDQILASMIRDHVEHSLLPVQENDDSQKGKHIDQHWLTP